MYFFFTLVLCNYSVKLVSAIPLLCLYQLVTQFQHLRLLWECSVSSWVPPSQNKVSKTQTQDASLLTHVTHRMTNPKCTIKSNKIAKNGRYWAQPSGCNRTGPGLILSFCQIFKNQTEFPFESQELELQSSSKKLQSDPVLGSGAVLGTRPSNTTQKPKKSSQIFSM